MRIANIAALAFVVIGVPWLVGLSFLDAFVVIPFACMPVFFVASLSARGPATRAALKGWLYGIVVLAASLVTVNILHWHGSVLLPPWEILLAAAGLSLAACFATGGAARFIPERTLRLGLMAVVVAVLFGYRQLPASWVAPFEADLSTGAIARKAWMLAAFLAAAGAVLLRRAANRSGAR